MLNLFEGRTRWGEHNKHGFDRLWNVIRSKKWKQQIWIWIWWTVLHFTTILHHITYFRHFKTLNTRFCKIGFTSFQSDNKTNNSILPPITWKWHAIIIFFISNFQIIKPGDDEDRTKLCMCRFSDRDIHDRNHDSQSFVKRINVSMCRPRVDDAILPPAKLGKMAYYYF